MREPRKVILLIQGAKNGLSVNRSLSCGQFVVRNNKLEGIRRHGTVFRHQLGTGSAVANRPLSIHL